MNRKIVIAGVVGVLGGGAIAWLALRKGDSPRARSGEDLARTYCQSCHLFPEPALLDKASWTNGALPDMAKWLGLAKPDVERTPDGQVVPGSDVFSPTPLLSREEWEAIVGYYAREAPDTLTPALFRGEREKGRPQSWPETKQFRVRELPYRRQVPMTLMARIDGAARRLYVGDAITHTIEALDATGARIFAVEFDSGPISILPRIGTPHPGPLPEGEGRALDLLLVGRLFPSDLMKGKLLRLQPGSDGMKIDTLLRNLRRPTHVAAADLNGDGREDFVICEFGNRSGRLVWFEGKGDGGFQEHVLSERAGAIRTEVRDMNGDGRPDIVALFGQAWEGVYLFLNEGAGGFSANTILQQHPLFGYSYFELLDFDKDGDLDLLTTNGDNGESAAPPKPYHGIRIYLNETSRRGGDTAPYRFTERWFFPLHGAYGARAADFDLDGDLDLAAISYFPDYANAPEESFVYLENTGNFQFRAATIPQHADGRWMTIDAGDLDGDGDADLVIGSLALGPPILAIPPAIQERWRSNAPAILLLENLAK